MTNTVLNELYPLDTCPSIIFVLWVINMYNINPIMPSININGPVAMKIEYTEIVAALFDMSGLNNSINMIEMAKTRTEYPEIYAANDVFESVANPIIKAIIDEYKKALYSPEYHVFIIYCGDYNIQKRKRGEKKRKGKGVLFHLGF